VTDNTQQHGAWASGQAADAYFSRNRDRLDADLPPSRSTQFFASFIGASDHVLEVGTANGHILEQLRRLTHCIGCGTDPSPAAIEDGRHRYPDLDLSVGTVEHIEFSDRSFSVVLLGFCLYLVDRHLLQRAVAEVDRVLADGGLLLITDFDPLIPHRREFKHQPGLWSYKTDYPALWLANPQYVLAEKIAFSHHADRFDRDPTERVASVVLVKQDPNVAYPVHA
jgi:SAM-dependent methyltransferase